MKATSAKAQQLRDEVKLMCAQAGYTGPLTWRDNRIETVRSVIDYCKKYPSALHKFVQSAKHTGRDYNG